MTVTDSDQVVDLAAWRTRTSRRTANENINRLDTDGDWGRSSAQLNLEHENQRGGSHEAVIAMTVTCSGRTGKERKLPFRRIGEVHFV